MDEGPLDHLVEQVRANRKYQRISESLIRRIGQRELAIRRTEKEAVKATRNKLHQIAGAYFDGKVDYDGWRQALIAAAESEDEAAFRAECHRLMSRHASTRERLPILDQFYTVTLAEVGPVNSILDLACGFNPLSLLWMPLAPGATYYACDIYQDLVDFLGVFFALAGVRGDSFVCDLLSAVPNQAVDLALLLKVLPPLEQVDPSASLNLLRSIKANYLLVTFPAQSLGGRSKGMVQTYEARFRALIAAEPWTVERFEFATELAFLIRKNLPDTSSV
jgi:16S rRNA (guanine(1405)-N(7))-methyltransferase